MKRCTGVGILALAVALLAAEAAPADEITTDVNIVTGLDISNSIEPDDLTLELAGMAQAISDPRVLKAIQAGEHRRIGFAVFAWHHGQFPPVVPWMVIGSAEDARIAANLIEARRQVNVELEVRRQAAWYIGRLTDLSAAIDRGVTTPRLRILSRTPRRSASRTSSGPASSRRRPGRDGPIRAGPRSYRPSALRGPE